MKTKQTFSVPKFIQVIRQEIYSSIRSMVETWQKRLEENSLNPPATYQKPLHHQPKTNQGILYEIPGNKPYASLKQKQPQKSMYSPSETKTPLTFTPNSQTLYETGYKLKNYLLYESAKPSTNFYPHSLDFGYKKSSSKKSALEATKVQFQYSS